MENLNSTATVSFEVAAEQSLDLEAASKIELTDIRSLISLGMFMGYGLYEHTDISMTVLEKAEAEFNKEIAHKAKFKETITYKERASVLTDNMNVYLDQLEAHLQTEPDVMIIFDEECPMTEERQDLINKALTFAFALYPETAADIIAKRIREIRRKQTERIVTINLDEIDPFGTIPRDYATNMTEDELDKLFFINSGPKTE